MRNKNRCTDHQTLGIDLKSIAACHVCQRLVVEGLIVGKVVDLAIASGYYLSTDQASDAQWTAPTNNRTTILDHLRETDSETLMLLRGPDGHMSPRVGGVFFVYGNDGYDVIADASTRLDDFLAPIDLYVAQLERDMHLVVQALREDAAVASVQ